MATRNRLTDSAKEYLRLPYSRVLLADPEGTFSAHILEFEGCFSSGQTAEEATRNIEEAMREWIESELEEGRDIPAPIEGGDFAGSILLRLPKSLHKRVALRARAEGTSMNQLLVSAVASYLSGLDVCDRVGRLLQR